MHDYLRAVGFSGISSGKKLHELIEYVKDQTDVRVITPVGSERYFVQLSKYFSEDVGISVVGEYDGDYNFYYDNMYPFVNGRTITYEDYINIKKRSDKDSYIGFCDDFHFGCTLIFALLNASDYIKSCWSNRPNTKSTDIRFSALSTEGTILLGVSKTPREYVRGKIWNEQKKKLFSAVRNDGENAMAALSDWDMINYTAISKRALKEDVLSIVDSSLMPYGAEYDQYSIVGTISSLDRRVNNYTGEALWIFTVDCNELKIDICINEKDLTGEPRIGRRFKGSIWLQGNVEII